MAAAAHEVDHLVDLGKLGGRDEFPRAHRAKVNEMMAAEASSARNTRARDGRRSARRWRRRARADSERRRAAEPPLLLERGVAADLEEPLDLLALAGGVRAAADDRDGGERARASVMVEEARVRAARRGRRRHRRRRADATHATKKPRRRGSFAPDRDGERRFDWTSRRRDNRAESEVEDARRAAFDERAAAARDADARVAAATERGLDLAVEHRLAVGCRPSFAFAAPTLAESEMALAAAKAVAEVPAVEAPSPTTALNRAYADEAERQIADLVEAATIARLSRDEATSQLEEVTRALAEQRRARDEPPSPCACRPIEGALGGVGKAKGDGGGARRDASARRRGSNGTITAAKNAVEEATSLREALDEVARVRAAACEATASSPRRRAQFSMYAGRRPREELAAMSTDTRRRRRRRDDARSRYRRRFENFATRRRRRARRPTGDDGERGG